MSESPRTLLDELLAEQQQLTAVERFSRRHEAGSLPAQARYYKDLIPRTKPGAGQQYGFVVELDACTGCKACVSACHSLNGLDDEETWRSVGIVHDISPDAPYLQTVTTACHHCVEPGCLEGCPVMAYDKDPETGIVRHLDDQCIGCQYCVLKCPYDVPKYSEKKGIVRKCDMCTNRLAIGEAPACVQACPTKAIRIELVDKLEVSRAAKPGTKLMPGAFDSDYTKPTTRYRTNRPMPEGARPGDADAFHLDHAHWPLIGMLLLTQMSVGLYAVLSLIGLFAPGAFESLKGPLGVAGFVTLNAGLVVSVFHLGRPLGAWRFFLGLRTSWMSREILVFSALAASGGACTTACLWEPLARMAPILHEVERFVHPPQFALLLGTLTTVIGLGGVFCSAMIYVDTRRAFWVSRLTFPRFFGSTALLGISAAASILACLRVSAAPTLSGLATATIVLSVLLRSALFGWEVWNFATSVSNPAAPIYRSSQTIWKLRPALVIMMVRLFVLSITFWLISLISDAFASAIFVSASFALTAASQLLERYFYFTAAAAPRMPGGISS